MTIFFAILLTVLTFAFITYPFFKQKPRSLDSAEDEKWQQLYSKRDTLYSMLKELEFDFHSGILTEEDYQNLAAAYKRKAISVLMDIEKLGKDTTEEEIERQVLELRRRKGRFCPQCGKEYEEDDRFCSHCGARLKGE